MHKDSSEGEQGATPTIRVKPTLDQKLKAQAIGDKLLPNKATQIIEKYEVDCVRAQESELNHINDLQV